MHNKSLLVPNEKNNHCCYCSSRIPCCVIWSIHVYHYVSAEEIVKRTSFVFEMIYEGDNWEVTEVEYLGRQTYYVKMQNEDTYIIQINGNKYHLEVDVYSGGQSYGVFLEYL